MRLDVLLQKTVILDTNADLRRCITGITCDSRCVKDGFLFVAIQGSVTDGANFIAQAYENGAYAVVAEHSCEGVFVRVPSAPLALAQLSACFYGYPAEKMIMVAVTGTNGKSSVTWLLEQALQTLTGQKIGLIGTLENHLGDRILPAERTTPPSDLLHRMLSDMVKAGCHYGVMETSSHAIDQCRIAGIPFQVGAFTNLTEDHLDYHGTMENYCRIKAKLFTQCQKAVLNLDDRWYPLIRRSCPADVLCISAKQEADIYAQDIVLTEKETVFTAICGKEAYRVCVPIPGSFTVYNSLTVLGILLQLGFSPAEAAKALEKGKPIKGRVEVVPTPGKPYTVILDYAHTPDGMQHVLRSLRSFCKGRLITVFGCGGDRDKGKRPIMGRIAKELADIAIITSDNPRKEPPEAIIQDILQGAGDAKNCKVLENRAQAIRYAKDIGK